LAASSVQRIAFGHHEAAPPVRCSLTDEVLVSDSKKVPAGVYLDGGRMRASACRRKAASADNRGCVRCELAEHLASVSSWLSNQRASGNDLPPAKLYFAGNFNAFDVKSAGVLKLKPSREGIAGHIICLSR